MPVFEDWGKYLSEVIDAEFNLSGKLIKHPVGIGDARESIIKSILLRFLPSIYEIGTGQIIDSDGGRSKQIDIVISRRDFPSLSMPSGSKIYLIESCSPCFPSKTL